MGFKNSACLFKIMRDENHINDFLKGNLYMKSSSYYREQYEDGDELEGIVDYFPKGHKIGIGYGENFKEYFEFEVQSSTSIKSEIVGITNCPILCLGMFWPEDDFTPENYDYNPLNRNVPLIDYSLKKYGDYVVLVEFDKFIEKVRKECKNKYSLAKGPVLYYDEQTYKRLLEKGNHPINSLFYKRNRFFKEREYRICIFSERIEKDKHFILKIGEISDICDVFPFEKVYREVRLAIN